jgi:hypothetical protein
MFKGMFRFVVRHTQDGLCSLMPQHVAVPGIGRDRQYSPHPPEISRYPAAPNSAASNKMQPPDPTIIGELAKPLSGSP